MDKGKPWGGPNCKKSVRTQKVASNTKCNNSQINDQIYYFCYDQSIFSIRRKHQYLTLQPPVVFVISTVASNRNNCPKHSCGTHML